MQGGEILKTKRDTCCDGQMVDSVLRARQLSIGALGATA